LQRKAKRFEVLMVFKTKKIMSISVMIASLQAKIRTNTADLITTPHEQLLIVSIMCTKIIFFIGGLFCLKNLQFIQI
jgi:hypothetical protein